MAVRAIPFGIGILVFAASTPTQRCDAPEACSPILDSLCTKEPASALELLDTESEADSSDLTESEADSSDLAKKIEISSSALFWFAGCPCCGTHEEEPKRIFRRGTAISTARLGPKELIF